MFSDAYAAFLDVLVEARKKAGITQAALAQSLGRPQPFVSYIERGERRVDVVEFCVIARAMGYDPADLFDQVLSNVPERLQI